MTTNKQDIKTEELAKICRAIPQEVFIDTFCDGHTIWDPERFHKMGFPVEYIKQFVFKEKSDGTSKGTIYVNGEAVAELEGVTSLSVLHDLAQRFGLHQAIKNSDGMMGRGFRVQALARPMYEWLHKEFKGGNHE